MEYSVNVRLMNDSGTNVILLKSIFESATFRTSDVDDLLPFLKRQNSPTILPMSMAKTPRDSPLLYPKLSDPKTGTMGATTPCSKEWTAPL